MSRCLRWCLLLLSLSLLGRCIALGNTARPIRRQILQAGGPAQWNPGPPPPIGVQNWQRELWRHLQHWPAAPALTRHVWLAYGRRARRRTPSMTPPRCR